ncbi:MAG: sigma-54-dependent Fis family transcriptional regulator [Candidatus Omnitrophica bacterium]|nr:sigma-54-dependent Fis family transcriptional regulator [Candidatus Omnitrophota bacterium]MCB9768822.1 sigma-54-dependent Fis family transcriptional regulator [Candidatus Omnitrophota bacterium]MCB9781669.1 sigma-54-dependent Fis family transcriptional regulator [Candidatus Omnitrophota bacterium]
MRTGKVLIVDDEENLCRILSLVLKDEGFEIEVANDGQSAVGLIDKNAYDCILTDVRMPELDGLALLREAKKRDPDQAVIVMTAYGNVQLAQEVMRAGAFDYVIKPFDNDELVRTIARAVELRRLRSERETLSEQLADQLGPGQLVGASHAMQQIGKAIAQVADTDATVLITGESGTGKELVARAIHLNSSRAQRAMVAVNCGAFPRELIESELFGHEKGAFTSANTAKVGLIEKANQSTLFLDELGELPLELQVKLLRVLESGEVRRVGAVTPRKVDVRIIGATNRDLRKEQEEGRFREDLYYRLSTFPIEIPPLRERKDDIPLLIDHFLGLCSRKMNRSLGGISKDAMETLQNFRWPGNVRELQNLLERLVITKTGQYIEKEDLPREILDPASWAEGEEIAEQLPYKQAKAVFEKRYFKALLKAHDYNVTSSALFAGLSRRHLQEKLREFKIRVSDQKNDEDED